MSGAPFSGLHCPDCAATAQIDIAPALRHEEACPVGRDIDRARANDRRWFRRNQGVRVRPLSWGERSELALTLRVDPSELAGCQVRVWEIAPGVRGKAVMRGDR